MPGDSLTLRNQQVLYCRILEYCSFPKDEEAWIFWKFLKYDICQGSEFQISVIRIKLPKYEVQAIFPGFLAKQKDTMFWFLLAILCRSISLPKRWLIGSTTGDIWMSSGRPETDGRWWKFECETRRSWKVMVGETWVSWQFVAMFSFTSWRFEWCDQ